MKYSECLAEWLVQLGYTHCFYVGGGNIMHLLESLSTRLDCRAVIHEGAAGIAAEYFNETSTQGRSLALVTAGPGLTNLVTAMAGAYLESRELLVIGGQVKTADLARGSLRQRGIQEIDGVAIARPVTVLSELVDEPLNFAEFSQRVLASRRDRKGPVFLEIPLDVQARTVSFGTTAADIAPSVLPTVTDQALEQLAQRIREARRPMFLLGGGISRETTQSLSAWFLSTGIPVGTTWNAADRMDAHNPVYVGRPNTWGQRSANLVLQQADLLVALGSRLGMQQTGFNWQQFVLGGKVVQVDLDQAELDKGHPRVDVGLQVDANDLLQRLSKKELGTHTDWMEYARLVRQAIPAVEAGNITGEAFISPFHFADRLSDLCQASDVVIPCSSGGAFTVMMQTFRQKAGQMMVTNKGLASMGYGLSGAIGAAFAHPQRRVVLVEGDGGFTQNLQEIGTAAINQLNLKMFIFDDSGYASIRMTQRSYFGGRYVGCDRNTGLGLPNWDKLFGVWDVPTLRIGKSYANDLQFLALFSAPGPAAFIVPVDPEQTYFPKIMSRVTETGTMESNPLHKMSPELPPDLQARVGKYL
jgi:acetolactate synthase-1/2/3 large subunit